MSSNTLSAQERADTTDAQPTTTTTAADLPAVIGVDCRGALHRYNAVANKLVVTDRDNEIVHEREMDVEELRTNWLAHVGRDRGWIDCWFDASHYTDVVGRLAAALESFESEYAELEADR
jgi:hypothetical protein